MRVEMLHGRKIVCGHIYPKSELKVGQKWAQADGADRVVEIREISEDEITYGEYGRDQNYNKDWFAFQCRYCLIVD